MRILITSGVFPPDIGGPATYIPQLSRDLFLAGHQVVVITLGARDCIDLTADYKVIKIGRDRNILFRVVKTLMLIVKELRNSDSFFSNGLYIESGIALALSSKKSVSVVKIVGDPVWERLRNRKKTNLSLTEFISRKSNSGSFILRKIYNWSWSKFDVATSPSKELCDFIEENIRSLKCIHIPNGVEISKTRNLSNEFDLVTVSRLVNWKNLDIVIRVVAKLNLSLLVVGDGPDFGRLQELAKQLEAKVTFTGQITGTNSLIAMNRARIFVQISDYEGLSFSLLEAMSLGLVPIVSNIPGNISVISNMHNGLIINIDEESLEKAINLVFSDSGLSEMISRNAILEISEKYNGKTQRSKVIELLRK